MYILLIGGGTMAYYLAKDLMSRSHEVLIVEQDRVRCADLSRDLGDIVLRGNGSDAGVLETAGAARADIVIATTRQDGDNLTACQIAKTKFRVPRAISTINDPRNEPLFKKLGVDVAISLTRFILSHIDRQLSEQSVLSLLDINPSGTELVSVKIPGDRGIKAKMLSEINLPSGTFISLIINKEGVPKAPRPDLLLNEHDEVIAVTAAEDEEMLRAALFGENSANAV